ncbi:MAG: CDC27 family protein [Chlamydiota bacterium]
MAAKQKQPLDSNEVLVKSYASAYALYKVGDYRRAQAAFIELIKADPLNSSYWFGFGSCLQMRRDYREALNAWRMTALLDDRNAICHFHAAECCFSMHQIDEGLTFLKGAEQRAPGKAWSKKISSLKQCWESKVG